VASQRRKVEALKQKVVLLTTGGSAGASGESLNETPAYDNDTVADLVLHARHPLRQITVEQAAVTFTDDLGQCLPDSNGEREWTLLQLLVPSLKRAVKAYNY